LTLENIEKMGVRQKITWTEKFLEKKERERNIFKLDIAECINYAYTGSQPPLKKGQRHPGVKAYKRWRTNLFNLIYPKVKKQTIWDRLEKMQKKKSMKVN
jgi:hypothetical protein